MNQTARRLKSGYLKSWGSYSTWGSDGHWPNSYRSDQATDIRAAKTLDSIEKMRYDSINTSVVRFSLYKQPEGCINFTFRC